MTLDSASQQRAVLLLSLMLAAAAYADNAHQLVLTSPGQHSVVPVVRQESTVSRTQYHAQNQAGEYVYGYVEPNAAKEERKLADGTVLGSYT